MAFYGAYGFKDREIKFGITPSYLAHKNSETWVSATYSDDINEICIKLDSQMDHFGHPLQ